MGTVAEMATTHMVRFKPGEKQVLALRDALFSDTGRDKDVRVQASDTYGGWADPTTTALKVFLSAFPEILSDFFRLSRECRYSRRCG